jgi:hypothetical protein
MGEDLVVEAVQEERDDREGDPRSVGSPRRCTHVIDLALGSSGVRRASPDQQLPRRRWNWRTGPWVKARRNWPSAEGASTAPNNAGMPLWRTTPRS